MPLWCSGLERVLMCVLGPGFNSCVVHFFSSTNNIIKSLQLLFCIDLYYYFYYSNIGYWRFHLDSRWNPHGIHMERWNPCENEMESMWKIPHGIHVENSMWNGGIHMESTPFHVEYRWKKITKMGFTLPSPHIPYGIHVEWTYSMDSTWIPCLFHVYSFHMDSIWIPCGTYPILRWNKDLRT